jgi:hypothetical protein
MIPKHIGEYSPKTRDKIIAAETLLKNADIIIKSTQKSKDSRVFYCYGNRKKRMFYFLVFDNNFFETSQYLMRNSQIPAHHYIVDLKEKQCYNIMFELNK